MTSRDKQLIKAAGKADHTRVARLIREGADVNATDKDGSTALNSALSSICFFKKTVVKGKLVSTRVHPLADIQRTVKYLLDAGADPNRFSDCSAAPLTFAASSECMPVLKMLVKAGANPNLQDANGDTCMLWALRRPAVVRYLLEQGADPNLKNREGKSALDIARDRSRLNPKEFRASYEIMRKVPARPSSRATSGSKATPPPVAAAGTKLGIADFTALMYRGHPEWSLLAVRAPAEKVAAEFARLRKAGRWEKNVALQPTQREERLAPASVVAGIRGNPWTVVLRSLFIARTEELRSVPEEAKTLSTKLKTRAIFFILEDTSNAMGYGLFENGRLLEVADWELGSGFARFESKLREAPDDENATDAFADQTFRWQGVYLPACYPRIEGKKVWVAVEKASKGMLERADVVG